MAESTQVKSRHGAVVAIAAIAVLAGLAVLVLVRRGEYVMVSVNLDPWASRPRPHAVLNPLRDPAPELLVAPYLEALRQGRPDLLLPLLVKKSPGDQQHVLQLETMYPIIGWRVGEITDDGSTIAIQYWVSRGNGYPDEEAVRFELLRARGSLAVKSYSAIY